MADEANITETEEWRDIPSFPGYQASSCGRIRSVDRVHYAIQGICTEAHAYRYGGQIIKQRVKPGTGYKIVSIRPSPGTQKTMGAHRLVCEAFHGPCPDGHEVAHHDGTRDNNCPSNLRWATHQENMRDQMRHGTFYKHCGGNTKISAIEAASIRELRAAGKSVREIAAMFDVSGSTIYNHVKAL